MARNAIPTARFAPFDAPARARGYCREVGPPLVVKADGLAGGKGAIVCRTLADADEAVAECMERAAFGAAGAAVVVEEFLSGEEVSFFALANGADALPLAAAQDHKTVFDGDQGPNTGGMGACSSRPPTAVRGPRWVPGPRGPPCASCSPPAAILASTGPVRRSRASSPPRRRRA